ncbi:MAG: 30S ribosomal protein S16 [Catalinimonas sp.]
MALKMRLARRGRKKLAMYDVVIADSRSPRDGRFVEKIGVYNPNTNPATVDIDEEKALTWLQNGALPTDTVRAMLSYRGVMLRRHLQIGINKGAVTVEQAESRYNEWKETKEAKISGKTDALVQKQAAERKARLEAERKVQEDRAEEFRKREAAAQLEVEEANKAAEAPAEGDEAAPAAKEGTTE